MQKLTAHSKSSLFLIEMILSILILALTCTACVRIFAAAKQLRQEARELNHIQELATCVGETLEGWDGELSSFSQIFEAVADTSDADTSSTDTSDTGISAVKSSDSASSNSSDVTAKNTSKQTKTSAPVGSYLLSYYYDSAWNSCDRYSADYTMNIQLRVANSTKTADLNFYDSMDKNLYHLSVSFPLIARKDGQS